MAAPSRFPPSKVPQTRAGPTRTMTTSSSFFWPDRESTADPLWMCTIRPLRTAIVQHRTPYTAHERLYVRCRLSIEATVPYTVAQSLLWGIGDMPDHFVADADQPFGSQGCAQLVEPGA